MHSENIWFKWSEKGKWKTRDIVGPGVLGDPGVPVAIQSEKRQDVTN